MTELVETKTKKPRAKKASTALVPEDVLALLSKADREGEEILATISGWKIQTQEDMNDCGAIKLEEREKAEALKARLKEITDPLRTAEKSARDLFRSRISMHEKNEAICTEAIRQFELTKMLEARAARQAVEAAGGQADERTLLVAHGHGAVEKACEVSTKRVFTFEVTDPAAIPERYYTRVLNEKLIQMEIDAASGGVVIPGIKINEDIKVSLAARR